MMIRRIMMAIALIASVLVSAASAEDDKALAARLDRECNAECANYKAQAKGGSMRATYEAATCLCACFWRGVPKDYPARPQYLACAKDNAAKAAKLGSDAAVIKGF